MSETGMTENQMYRFTMGSVLDPLVVANKGAPRKNYNSSTKTTRMDSGLKHIMRHMTISAVIVTKGVIIRESVHWE
jgi:hypothetical protein